MRLVLVGLLANLLFGQPEVFVVNESGRSVQPVLTDPVRRLDPFTTPNAPAFFFVSADRTKYYSVSRSATATVAVLSAAQPSTVLKTLDLAAATAAVMTPDRSQLVIATPNTLYRIDTATDTITETAFINAPVKELVASLDGSRVFALTTQVVMFRINPFVAQSTTVLPGPLETMAMNHTGLLYATAQGRVHEIDGTTGEPLRTIETSGRPGRLAFSPSGRVAVAGNLSGSASMFRFDLVAGAVSGTISSTSLPFDHFIFLDEDRAVGLSPQGLRLVPLAIEPLRILPGEGGSGLGRGIVSSPEFPSPREYYVNYDGAADQFETGLFPSASRSFIGPGVATVSPLAGVGAPAHLYAFNGEQTALPGQPYRLPLTVRVTNRIGRPLGGVPVQFSTGQTVVSNLEGWAQTFATAPLAGGLLPVTATAGDARAVFRLGSPASSPASITILDGQGQLVYTPSQGPRPLLVVVKDTAGFPVPDAALTFSLTAGTGRLGCTGANGCTVRTDGSGMAVIGFHLDTPPSVSSFEQHKIDIICGAAPPKTAFITTHAALGNIVRQTIAPPGTTVSTTVNSLVSSAVAIRFWGSNSSNVFQPLPNIGLNYTAPLHIPDLRCDAEGGTVLSDSTGLATCSLATGGLPGHADLIGRMHSGRQPDLFNPLSVVSRIAIVAAGQPTIHVLAGRDQTVRRGQTGTALLIRLLDAQGAPMPNQPLQWSIEGLNDLSLLMTPSAQTDNSGLGYAGVVAPSTFDFQSRWFLVRVRSNGALAEIPIFLSDTNPQVDGENLLSSYGGTLRLRITHIGAWTVQGLPPWMRTSATSGVGSQWIVLEYDANPSPTISRTVSLTVGGIPLELVQPIRPLPTVSAPGAPYVTSGASANINVNFHAALSAARLNVLNILIRDSLDGSNACYIAYSVPQRVLYLASDQGPNVLSPPITLPSQQSLGNSQCTIHGADSFVIDSSTTVSLRLRITFSPSFGGSKLVYGGASDLAGISSGWRIVGVHSAPSPIVWPRPVSALPSVGFGNPISSFEFEDSTDARNLETVWILANSSLDARQACYLAYHVPSNQLFLFPDSGLASGVQSMSLTSAGLQLSNSSCFVSSHSATVTVSGRRLTLSFNGLSYSRAGDYRAVWLAAKTLSGQVSTWQAMNVLHPFN